MRELSRRITLALCLVATTALAEDEQRDFYAEPGLNPFKSASGQDSTEQIDNFSGHLQLNYLDIAIPGNGGLHINITRFYSLPQSSPGYANPYGYGWTMHYGRITIGSGHASQLCGGEPSPDNDTSDNPSIEMPDGRRELLVRSSALNDGNYVTKSNWKARCLDPEDYKAGIVATSPNGVAYLMTEYVYMQGEDGPTGEPAPEVETWLTRRIVDPYGNSIDIGYLEIASGMKLITRLDSSDGRRVDFEYLDPADLPVNAASTNARLASISANGQSWRYGYAPIEGGRTDWGKVHHYKLSSVTRPDGSQWEYQYGTDVTAPDYNRLTQVTYPSGGQVNYTYQWLRPYLPNPDFRIVAIKQKTITNPGHAEGTWTWEFHPGASDMADLGILPLQENAGRMADLTRIITPIGEEEIYHVGYWAMVGRRDILWEMGLKLIHRVLERDLYGGLQLVRSESNSWDRRAISAEVYRGGILSALWDDRVYAPLLTRRAIELDGHVYATDYSNHDVFGNPGTTTEWAIYPTEGGNRITEYTYLNDTDNWFIGLPTIEVVSQDGAVVGSIARTYNDLGQLTETDRFGVIERFGYSTEGDLASITDALGNTTRYSDYFRGQPQREERPDGTQLTRSINPSGTVGSRTSPRGFTTSFAYDGLNRLTGIDYPRGEDVDILWRATGKSLTRGDYREDIGWDGFGLEVEFSRHDLSSGERYTRYVDFDAMGRKIFESDINSSLGIAREYDADDRVVRVIYQDGTSRSITHDGAHHEVHRDENGNTSEHLYQVYGSPESRHLSWILSPESVGTWITRDALGNITSVFQGETDPENPAQYLGYTQTYRYNERLQLIAIDSPADIGTTNYERDRLGNMTRKQVENANAAHFSYDSMNRLIAVDYLDDSLDASYTYDADGQPVEISNGFSRRGYEYDENGDLVRENIDIGGTRYTISYQLDGLGHIDSINYPSGRSVYFAQDALGRPTQALPYLSAVQYFPEGSVRHMRYTNGETVDYSRTARHWIDLIDADDLLQLDYGYDAAGNVTMIIDPLNQSANRSMGYDGLHRLVTASGPWGEATYTFDGFSNLLLKNDPARSNRIQEFHYSGMVLDRISYPENGAERVFSYDGQGNVSYSDDAIFDPVTGLPVEILTSRQQSFDDAGNMAFTMRSAKSDSGEVVPLWSGSFSSEYDALNNRVRKIDHSEGNRATDHVYSKTGLLIGEYDSSGAYYGHEYFYLGDRQIASAKFNSPPVIDLEEAVVVDAGKEVRLSADYSDPDGEVATSEWQQISGPVIVIDEPSSREISFVAPASSESYVIALELTATDDRGGESSSVIEVTVNARDVPETPSAFAIAPGDRGNLLSWQPVADATFYRVYWTTEPNLELDLWNDVTITAMQWLHAEIPNGTRFYYGISAASEHGESAISSVLAATPGEPAWQPANQIPAADTQLFGINTSIATNDYGAMAIVSEQFTGTSYQLQAWQFDSVSGWTGPRLLHAIEESHSLLQVDMDHAGNLLVAWASGSEENRSLYSLYVPFGGEPQPVQLVEHYAPDNYVSADIRDIAHLEFSDDGQAWICWRQNILHAFRGYYDRDGSSAIAKRFDPVAGWVDEHRLEVSNNVGDTLNLSCDVAGNGRVLAAWERNNSFDPRPVAVAGEEHDVWIAAFHPGFGWTDSETIEFLASGEREANGMGIQNRNPQAAVGSQAKGAVVWFNETDTNIESILYDFATSSWSTQQSIETRGNRIAPGSTPSIAANESGDIVAGWGNRFSSMYATSSSWERAGQLPATPLVLGVDQLGRAYSLHVEGGSLIANRRTTGGWHATSLYPIGDTGQLALLSTSTSVTNALSAVWASANQLFLSSDQLPLSLPENDDVPDSVPPTTTFSSQSNRVKGSTTHDIRLSTSELATTFFRFQGQGDVITGGANDDQWQTYTDIVRLALDKKGEGYFEYYSVDMSGNRESTKRELLN
jgi:YD repeat-containing protein